MSPNWPPFLWHHRVHTEKRGERLSFWRVSLTGGYDRDSVTVGIQNACRRCRVGGVIVYELFGVHDILIRAWLPNGCGFDTFDRALRSELEPSGLSTCDSFDVDDIVRHWPFERPGVSPSEDPVSDHIAALEDSEIDELESQWPEVRPELVERLKSESLIASLGDLDAEKPGIKFAIEVRSGGTVDASSLAGLERQLIAVIAEADTIAQRSLYSGSGFAQFLIMGRVDYEEFHSIHRDLISPINGAKLRERFETRTLTHMSGQRGYRIAQDWLSAETKPGRARKLFDRLVPRRDESDSELQPGEVFAERFEVVGLLGKGGFARVYEVIDQGEEVKRALKIFRSDNRKAARREMNALRRISHPNVVDVIWGDHEGPNWYLVTEFVEGQTLDACFPGDDVWALSVMIQILQGLQAVHPDDARMDQLKAKDELTPNELNELQSLQDNGLIHRDIKPQNVIVGEDGHVTIVDFNIASPARSKGETRSGTPEYMAPDAGFGGWEPTDDLFSCGVVLYELLVGAHPFPGEQPAAGVEPIDPLTIRPSLPDSLAKVLRRACAPSRPDRFQTAEEIRTALEAERVALQAFEYEVRVAVWEWQRGKDDGSTPEDGVTPRPANPEGRIKLAQILRDQLEDGPFHTETPDEDPEGELAR